MNSKGVLKIKFKTAIKLILLLLTVIAIVSIIILNIKNKEKIKTKDEVSNLVNSDFELEFLKMENNNQNMIYSPLSIKYALNMLNEGASGNTKKQIEKVIGNSNLAQYEDIKKVLSFANGVYIRDSYSGKVKKEYINILKNKYNAEIKYDSFNNANNINKWIENKTLGIIKNMLQDSMVQDKLTKMLLINALAIDMEWEDAFECSDTHGENFKLNTGENMIATTLNKETKSDSFSYYKEKEITALSIDLKKYDNTQLEFISIMPNGDLSNYIESFTNEELNNIINKMKPASKEKNGIEISIPKFSFDYDLKLKDDLIKLGVIDAFDEDLANFSNMTNSIEEQLYVKDALHKANVDFSEKGIKAAAVTVLVMFDTTAISDMNKPKEIKIDKPFIYFIKDKNTDEIWFTGTVYEPNSWEEDKSDYQY